MSKKKRSLFRRVNEWLHLWLGLTSGLVVFVVCFCACLWVFRYEVWYFTETYQRVEPQQKPFLAPSVLMKKAQDFAQKTEGKPVTLTGITYGRTDKSAFVSYQPSKEAYYAIYLNPYTGEIIHRKTGPSTAEAFFIFARSGHRFFFLPPAIGSPIVGSACIIFVILMITGLIWWYPQKWTKSTRAKSFTIKWGATWKRINLDLHNVLGFYALLVCMALTISGIVYSFHWFDKSYHWLLTGNTQSNAHGDEMPPPHSDTTLTARVYANPEDRIWQEVGGQHPDEVGKVSISFPKTLSDPYEVLINPEDPNIYKMYHRFFDRNSLAELPSEESRRYEDASTGEKIYRLNFDIHVGQIGGLSTRILAFFVSLIGASLPITGFIIWWNRGKKSSRRSGSIPDTSTALGMS
ncbi:PepSY domain-containing protein [Spirosoma sp. HMF4905]|uniref:PepSY domain-containing protein n=1 Tax=Spirosoma arboris TaxID=2682092 RepID=A0A7K1SJI7_9BACT|nr:PepSY-associated TM helix domain-containing protein [Spirosoma arboris]MVM33970.1 PepSY domain-containing protein [Spirosoma arboris]